MVSEPPKPCLSCQGMFGMVESCKRCKGTGVDASEIEEISSPGLPLPPVTTAQARAGKRIPRVSRKDPGRLSYETLIKAVMTSEKILTTLFTAGFDQALSENLDDESTSDSLREAFEFLIRADLQRRVESRQAKGRGEQPPPPSELLKLARAIRDLKDVRNDIGEATIN